MSASQIPGGVTVVMPLYNKGAHVDRAIRSVLAQTGGFDALIVVDDGSTDDGPERVRAFGDPRIQLLHRSPPGPGGYAARNHAINAAKTRWIAFLDADDAWKPGFISAVKALITRSDQIGCAFTAYERVDPSAEIRLSHTGAVQGRTVPIDLPFDAFLRLWIDDRDCPIWTGSTCFRRDVLLQAGLFPEGRCRRGGDKDLWLRAMSITTASYDPRPLATYYRDATNMVTNTVRTHSAHCVVETIRSMIETAPMVRKKTLKLLSNVETFNYCISAARTNGMNNGIYSVFYNQFIDYRYYIIKLISICPSFARPFAAKIVQRVLGLGK